MRFRKGRDLEVLCLQNGSNFIESGAHDEVLFIIVNTLPLTHSVHSGTFPHTPPARG
jgi:hypothetical protein